MNKRDLVRFEVSCLKTYLWSQYPPVLREIAFGVNLFVGAIVAASAALCNVAFGEVRSSYYQEDSVGVRSSTCAHKRAIGAVGSVPSEKK